MEFPHTGPFISICIPTYRRTEFIRQSLGSAVNQTYKNYEIIVHDDTQDGAIKGIVESFHSDKIRYFQNIPSLGLVPKLNDFLEKARAEWVLILCDDDFLDPEYLAVLSSHIKRYPNATIIRCRYRLVDQQGNEIRLDRLNAFETTPSEFLRDIFKPESQSFKMNISGIIFRRNELRARGGFKNLYRGWHVDRLAWTELGAAGISICEPSPLCNIRLHAGSITAGIEADYITAVATDLKMKEIAKNILDEASASARSPSDKMNLHLARKNFEAYIHRHLARSLDHGFLAALSSKKGQPSIEMRKIFKVMENYNLPGFRSVLLYRLIAPLPLFIRSFFLSRISQYKVAKRM